MIAPRFSLVPVLGHEIHVTEWGDPAAPALVMWHGLARTGRDFDELAAALADRYFVLCPDTIGRGMSSWSRNPVAEYSVEFYTGIAADLLDHYGIVQTAWIGTSMGGMIGMRMASGPLAQRLRCLIINDIGPEVPAEAVERILSYAGTSPGFANLHEAETWFRSAYRPFGENSDEFWRRMALCSVRRRRDGLFTLHYDPNITVQFSASAHELTSWDRYDRITLPVHVIQGADSDILTGDIMEEMTRRGPRPGVSVFSDCGHAPTLSRPENADHIAALLRDLLG